MTDIVSTGRVCFVCRDPFVDPPIGSWCRTCLDADGATLVERSKAAEPLQPPPIQKPTTLEQRHIRVPIEWMQTAPPPRRFLLRHPDGPNHGFIPMGAPGILSAAGGSSKSMAMVQLAVSIATGRPWLGHFIVTPESEGRVLLALAEETEEEVWRRINACGVAQHLTSSEQERVSERVEALPLAGVRVALLEGGDGIVSETPVLGELRTILGTGNGLPYSLVVLDPLSRWGGGECEGDNETATRLVQILESLASSPGGPTVILVHHSSKFARRAGQADARGVTALTDGPRFALELRNEKAGGVKLALAKSNYAPPMKDELELYREEGGILSVVNEALREDLDDMKRLNEETLRETYVTKLIEVIRKAGGRFQGGASALSQVAGIPRDSCRAAIAVARTRGLITETGSTRDRFYMLVTPQ